MFSSAFLPSPTLLHPAPAGNTPNQVDCFNIYSVQQPCQSLVERVLISSEKSQVLATENKTERRGLNNTYSSVLVSGDSLAVVYHLKKSMLICYSLLLTALIEMPDKLTHNF